MLNYYDEMKEAIKKELEYDYAKEVLENAENKDDAYEKLEEIFFVDDEVTGNASGSYYFNSYESRKHCYEYSVYVKEALKEFSYDELLVKFKIFENARDYSYIDVNMRINEEVFEDLDEYDKLEILAIWEEIQDIDFEKIDVITRCYLLGEVLSNVLDEIF